MRSAKFVLSVFVLGMLVAVTVPKAKADDTDWDTFLTFSAPVEVPGRVLAPGTYEFRLMDDMGAGYVVTILDSNGRYVEAVQAEPAYRTQIIDKPVVKLGKRNQGSPEYIKSWFYPDEYYGVRFIYPKLNKTASTS